MVTWCQVEGGRSDKIAAKRFPTKVLNLFALPSNHDNIIVLSHHATVLSRDMSSACLTEVKSLANRAAPQSSNRGIDKGLMLATRVLAETNVQVGG